jgi:hypothetical protein
MADESRSSLITIVPDSYIIYKTGGLIKAVNGNTDLIDYSGTDPATVINNTLNGMTSGGLMFIKKGFYDTSSATINLNNDNTELYMESGAWLQPLSGTNDVVAVTANNCRLIGVNIDGSSGGAWGINVGGVSSLKSNFWIDHCNLNNCGKLGTTGGILLGINSGSAIVSNNLVHNSTVSGSYGLLINFSGDHQIFGNVFGGFVLDGLLVNGSGAGDITITANELDSNAHNGINLFEPTMVSVVGNQLIENYRNGIAVGSFTTGNLGNVSITGNVLRDNSWTNTGTYDGIFLDAAAAAPISNIACIGNISSNRSGVTQRYGITLNSVHILDSSILGNSVFNNASGGINIVARDSTVGIRNNPGFVTENTVLSPTFGIDTIGLKGVTIPHGLSITPNNNDCSLTVLQNTVVTDWLYNLLAVTSTDATNVYAEIIVTTATGHPNAVANLGLRVGSP